MLVVQLGIVRNKWMGWRKPLQAKKFPISSQVKFWCLQVAARSTVKEALNWKPRVLDFCPGSVTFWLCDCELHYYLKFSHRNYFNIMSLTFTEDQYDKCPYEKYFFMFRKSSILKTNIHNPILSILPYLILKNNLWKRYYLDDYK